MENRVRNDNQTKYNEEACESEKGIRILQKMICSMYDIENEL